MFVRTSWIVVACLTAVGACQYDPVVIDCRIRCGEGLSCPEGSRCGPGGFCESPGQSCSPADAAVPAGDGKGTDVPDAASPLADAIEQPPDGGDAPVLDVSSPDMPFASERRPPLDTPSVPPEDAGVADLVDVAAEAPPPDAIPPSPDVTVPSGVPNLLFVTSTMYTGNLGGLAGADATCAARARAAGLPGTFVALLSTSTVNARDRLGQSSGWARPDGRPVADTQADLFAGRLLYPPKLDEFGKTVPPWFLGKTETTFSQAHTGSRSDGTVDPDNTCKDWRSQEEAVWSSHGMPEASNGTALVEGWGLCSGQTGRLYCLAVDNQARVAAQAPAGTRKVFVSAADFDPSTGLQGADALCAREASAARLSGTFVAYLASAGGTAASRLGTEGAPWARTDSVLVVESAADLATARLLAAIDVTAAGQKVSRGVWTGSESPTAPATRDCYGWTSRSSIDRGLVAVANYSGPGAFHNGQTGVPCDREGLGVYCFER